jgi:hypothetical protein
MDEIIVRESNFYQWSSLYGTQKLQAGEWCSYDAGVEEYMNNNNATLKNLKPK